MPGALSNAAQRTALHETLSIAFYFCICWLPIPAYKGSPAIPKGNSLRSIEQHRRMARLQLSADRPDPTGSCHNRFHPFQALAYSGTAGLKHASGLILATVWAITEAGNQLLARQLTLQLLLLWVSSTRHMFSAQT